MNAQTELHLCCSDKLKAESRGMNINKTDFFIIPFTVEQITTMFCLSYRQFSMTYDFMEKC